MKALYIGKYTKVFNLRIKKKKNIFLGGGSHFIFHAENTLSRMNVKRCMQKRLEACEPRQAKKGV